MDNTKQVNGSVLLLTAEEAAGLLSVSMRHFLKMVSQQNAPQPVRLGRNVRWRLNDLAAWTDAGCPAVTTP